MNLPPSTVWIAQAGHDDQVLFRIGRCGDTLIAQWPEIGTLAVDRAGLAPQFAPEPTADPTVVAKVRAGAVRALLYHLRGGLALHASAVALDDHAIAFVGDSGAGKSTLAVALATLAEHRFALLADDCLSIEQGSALPTDTTAWLDTAAKLGLGLPDDGVRSAVTVARVANRPARMLAVVHLQYGDVLGLTRPFGAARAALLTRAMIRLVLDEPDVHRADLEMVAHLACQVEVLELTRPRGFEHMERTAAILQQLLC